MVWTLYWVKLFTEWEEKSYLIPIVVKAAESAS
jgi:hypothetical protein